MSLKFVEASRVESKARRQQKRRDKEQFGNAFWVHDEGKQGVRANAHRNTREAI